MAEESASGATESADRVWVVDPLDGTLNFSRGLPFYCVVIGYVEEGVARAAAVHAPRLGETFVATHGGGATLNGLKLRVSETTSAAEAFAVSSLGFGSTSKAGSRFVALNKTCARLRVIGSAALEICYVAAGRVDLFVHEFLSPWDIAGPQLIAREAGATVLSLATGKDAAWNERAVVVGNAAVVSDAIAKMPLIRAKRR